jgi:hypothetical protein
MLSSNVHDLAEAAARRQLDTVVQPAGEQQTLDAEPVWSAWHGLLDVAVPLQTAERPVNGALDVAGALGQLLQREAGRRVAQDLEDAHELVHQLDVVSGRLSILRGRTHLNP